MKRTTRISKSDGEYRVRLYIDDVYQAGADYYTNDKQDAHGTAEEMQKHGTYSDKQGLYAVIEAIKDKGGYAVRAGWSGLYAVIEAIEERIDAGAVLYDSCNDYSLEESTRLYDEDWSQYRVVAQDGTLYLIHKEYNELHYVVK